MWFNVAQCGLSELQLMWGTESVWYVTQSLSVRQFGRTNHIDFAVTFQAKQYQQDCHRTDHDSNDKHTQIRKK